MADQDGAAEPWRSPEEFEQNLLMIAEDDSAVCWLDFATGRQGWVKKGTMLSTVLDEVRRRGWTVAIDHDQERIRVSADSWPLRYLAVNIRAFEEGRRLCATVELPGQVPEVLRTAVAEFLLRVNWRFTQGCFDLNCSTGDLVFRTSSWIADGTLTSEMAGVLLDGAITTVYRYVPWLLKVTRGGVPKDVVAQIEELGTTGESGQE